MCAPKASTTKASQTPRLAKRERFVRPADVDSLMTVQGERLHDQTGQDGVVFDE